VFNQGGSDGKGMWHAKRHTEIHTGFWWVNFKGQNHSETLGTDGMAVLKWILK